MYKSSLKRIGFGAWQIGGENIVQGENTGWASLDRDQAKKVVKDAYEGGIRFYDTADFYGKGTSESIIGEVLHDKNDVEICTKVGWKLSNETAVQDFSPAYITSAIQQSLKRLQRTSIDYLLLHNPPAKAITRELIQELSTLKKRGILKNIGISAGFLSAYEEHFNSFDCFECVYNPITTQNLPFIQQLKHKKVFIRSVFASGLLLKDASFFKATIDFEDWRKSLPQILLANAAEYVEKNKDLQERKTLILKECLAINPTVCIVGFKTSAQVNEVLTRIETINI